VTAQHYGGKVIKTSLSDEDTKKLQDALTPEQPVPSSTSLSSRKAASRATFRSSISVFREEARAHRPGK
jgi:hypothetical protein